MVMLLVSVCCDTTVQVDQEPSIRANTTVLLGNIAQYLGDQYCKKVRLMAGNDKRVNTLSCNAGTLSW
jgi:hypothetical protein